MEALSAKDEALREINSVQTYSAIGPAHVGHPEHLTYYTADNVALDDPEAETHVLRWVGYGNEAMLTKVPKEATE